MSSQTQALELTAIKNYLLPLIRPGKRFPLLPGARSVSGEAAFIGISEDELMEARIRYDQTARQAALELLKEDVVQDAMEARIFGDGGRIAVVGDSISEDAQGWAAILAHLLDIGAEGDFKLINASGYGYTSLDALRTIERDVIWYKPDHVIVALGTLDALRLYGAPNRTLVSLAEFWENLSTMESMVGEVTKNPVIWITPAPVVNEQVDELALFAGNVAEADLHDYRQVVAGKPGVVVDPYGHRFGHPVNGWHLQADGFHHSLAGHQATLKALCQALMQAQNRT